MVTVKKNINKLNDANFFLYSLTQPFHIEELKKGMETSCFEEAQYNRFLDTFLKIRNLIESSLSGDKEQIDFYFKSMNENDVSISDFVLIYEFLNYDVTLEENITRVQNLSEEERLLEYAKILTEYHSQGNIEEAKKIRSLADMLNILNESEISDKNKIAIIDTFCNTDKHLKQLTNLLRKTIGILEDCSKEYQYIEEFFYEYWSDFISKNDIIEHIEKYINVEWKRNPAGIVVTPVLAQPRMVSISIPDEEVVKPDVLRIGFLIDKNLRLRKKATTMEDIGNIMKVFGDKSKLDILNMIKDKPAYGKELADGLGLAKGTISHHMSSLMSIGVIDTLCESNRIYYSLNQKKFTEILEELKEYFVKPENR